MLLGLRFTVRHTLGLCQKLDTVPGEILTVNSPRGIKRSRQKRQGAIPPLKHIPSVCLRTFWKSSTRSPSSRDLLDGPPSQSHTGERGEKRKEGEKGHILFGYKARRSLPLRPDQWNTAHSGCINICLWLKFKRPCVAARHNRKPSSQGKCLLQRWPRERLPARGRL